MLVLAILINQRLTPPALDDHEQILDTVIPRILPFVRAATLTHKGWISAENWCDDLLPSVKRIRTFVS